jgi:hypothetical protein
VPLHQLVSSFSSTWKKTKAKEDALAPLHLARRRWGRRVSELALLRQADTLVSAPIADARRGTKGNLKTKDKNTICEASL